MRRAHLLAAVPVLLLAACSGGDDGADSIALGTGGPSEEESVDDAVEGDDTDGREDAPADTADPEGTDDPAADPTGANAGADGDLVDLTEAIAGTWPVGDAGTVTFSIVDGALTLDDVTAAEGWDADIDEHDADEIEVDFRRGDVEWKIGIELEDGGTILEIEIDQDVERADTGSYDISDAGTFAFDVEDGSLVLTDLSVVEGWTVVERDEASDEIDLELVNGPRRFEVEVELEDDGSIEVEIDYEVAGLVGG